MADMNLQHRSSIIGRAALVTLCLAVVVGCSHRSSSTVQRDSGTTLFPFESLRDWKSYGDNVAVVQITSEDTRKNPQAPSGPAVPEFVNPPSRYVTATVENDLWSRQQALPEQIEFLTDVANYRDGKWEGFDPRVKVGERYLIAFIQYPKRLTYGAVATIKGDQIVPEPSDSDKFQEVAGLSVDELDAKLAGIKPYPAAEKYADQSPQDRYAAVLAAQEQQSPTSNSKD